MPYLTSKNNIRWHYEATGQGESLLFIHGLAADKRVWNQQVEYFKNFYKVITVDLPGHGQSPWLDVTLEDIVRDLDFLLNALGVTEAHLAASSFGGLVALKYFEIFPDKVKRLILIGAGPKFAKSREFPYGLEIPRIRKLRSQVETNFPEILNIFFRSLFTLEERKSLRFKWLQMFQKDNVLPRQEALIKLLRILEKEDLTRTFLNICVPVFCVSGAQDYICPPEALRHFQSQLPQARVEVFAGCGHFPFLSKPREFNERLKIFLCQEGHVEIN